LLGGDECRAGDRQQGGAGNKCFPHRTLHRFEIRPRPQLRRTDRAHKLSFGHVAATIHKA
jgi:hypothetical protein